jgi:long-chain acyl-CoA synthetase
VYPSLGPDALSFSLNQTESSHLICQASLMDVVARTAGSLKPTLRCVIYMDELTPTQVQEYQKKIGRELLAWSTVMERGVDLAASGKGRVERAPQPEDLAVCMYTSGSTGTPASAHAQTGDARTRL